MEYIILGDTEKYKGCLLLVIKGDRDHAEKVLRQMLNNPTDNKWCNIERFSNLRIEEVEVKDCWWNDPFLVN